MCVACVTPLLEGLSEAVLRLLSGRALSCDFGCRTSLLPAGEQAHRPSSQTQAGRFVTGEAVDALDKARGYDIDENEFVFVEDRDLAEARSERPPPGSIPLMEPWHRANPPIVPATGSEPTEDERAPEDDEDEDEELEEGPTPPVQRPPNTRTIEIERFLPVGQIDGRYFEKPYYIVPRELVGQEAFAVIRDAMSRAKVVGLARVVLSSRERLFLLEPMGSGLHGVTLRFAHEVRSETDYFSDIPEMKLPTEMVKLAQHIIKTKSENFAPSMLEDHYRNALVRILRKKQAKRAPHPAPVKPSAENVVYLMDSLRRSIAAEKRSAARSASRRSPARSRRSGKT